ncbi:iron-sulfur cluster carrier protein [Geothrix oryzae]|jgi:ATP-binding protein involved in chromosome partitioning|uniref:Iron-sulfur cluster carrier protein n=1 Tax=Geothrix oryzae TaxID=2927975 RepID=A0ABN6UZM6_9BACT|nr:MULTISPECIES: Mrp/NBP35 family ATP-binding protein [Geothrix]BDU70542.1 iron-sulfur cluster carrier protein [Geothrix oryzae]
MTKISRAALFEALNAYTVPGTNATLTTLKAVKGIDVTEGKVTVLLQLMEAYRDRVAVIKEALEGLIRQQPGVTGVDIEIGWEKTAQVEFKNLIPGIKRCVVVGSGKGGVGKSTVTVNLAIALSQLGLKVGLLDSDIYGPSIPMMLGLKDSPLGTPDGQILPIEKFGIKIMSMGLLIEEDRPVIWRGAMLNKALQQFLKDVAWGDLDVLLIDLPPGTGDVQLTLIQNAQVDGAVIVSTPQDVAFLDAKKAIGMFGTVKVPVLGIIENMSSFICPGCGQETQIFGHGGVKAAAVRMELPFLGEVPIDLAIREGGDSGKPFVAEHPQSPQTKVFQDMADTLKGVLKL